MIQRFFSSKSVPVFPQLCLVFGLVLLCLGALPWDAKANPNQELWSESELAQAIETLATAVRLPTISAQDKASSAPAFDKLHRLFQSRFPQLYIQLEPRRIADSLLIYWPGKNKSLRPALILAHLDVVPVEPGTENQWQYPPFSGKVDAQGYIWGRGTLDDKVSALGILEAVEKLLKSGFQPQRSLYIALGHDEEVGGHQGAAQIAKYLKTQGLRFEFALDEGLAVVPGSMIGLKSPVALIGVAEKGYLTLKLEATGAGGHSSMPPRETAVGILSSALHRLGQSPLPSRLTPTVRQMFERLGPEMGGLNSFLLGNLWLFEPLILQNLAERPATDALIRTTLAPTMLMASPKENVLPLRAQAIVNLRVLPGDSLPAILSHFQRVIADPRIKIDVLEARMASPESRVDGLGFEHLEKVSTQVFPEAKVVPALVLAATDSRNYEALCEDMYRFLPVFLTEADLERIHGSNERIAIPAFQKMLQFYYLLLSEL